MIFSLEAEGSRPLAFMHPTETAAIDWCSWTGDMDAAKALRNALLPTIGGLRLVELAFDIPVAGPDAPLREPTAHQRAEFARRVAAAKGAAGLRTRQAEPIAC